MKTQWDIEYVWRRYGNGNEWANRKRRELEEKYGCPWSWNQAHGKFVFTPTFNRETSPIEDEERGTRLMELVKGYGPWYGVSFIKAVEQTGYPIADIVAIVRWLQQQTRVMIIINRMGAPAGYYLRKEK